MSNWFIALKVDPAGWFDALPATPEGVTLEHPSDLHVTLGFYGPNEAAARDGFEVAKRAFAACEAEFEGGCILGGAVTFMFTAPGRETLATLMRAIQDGSEAEKREPLPHVTLARLKRHRKRKDRDAANGWIAKITLTHTLRFTTLGLYTANKTGESKYALVASVVSA